MLVDPDTIEYIHYNDRDFEVPLLLRLVEESKPRLLLDVGAYYSWYTYAPYVRAKMAQDGIYDAIDIVRCRKTEALVDHFSVGSVLDLGNVSYDFVSCISVVEHCGITTYHIDDVEQEQDRVVEKMLDIATSNLLVTCPFGAPGVWEGEYRNITETQAARWTKMAEDRGFTIAKQWLYNIFPQGKEKWCDVGFDIAKTIPIDKTKGVQCNMIFHATK